MLGMQERSTKECTRECARAARLTLIRGLPGRFLLFGNAWWVEGMGHQQQGSEMPASRQRDPPAFILLACARCCVPGELLYDVGVRQTRFMQRAHICRTRNTRREGRGLMIMTMRGAQDASCQPGCRQSYGCQWLQSAAARHPRSAEVGPCWPWRHHGRQHCAPPTCEGKVAR